MRTTIILDYITEPTDELNRAMAAAKIGDPIPGAAAASADTEGCNRYPNPFLFHDGQDWRVGGNVWVEVFYTDDVNIEDLKVVDTTCTGIPASGVMPRKGFDDCNIE